MQQQIQDQRLDAIKADVRRRHPEFKEASVARLAQGLYDAELNAGEEISEEYKGEYQRARRVNYAREKLLDMRSSPTTFERQHEQRVAAMCEKILNDNPTLRQRVANKARRVVDPLHIDYQDPQNFDRTRLIQAAYEGNLPLVTKLVEGGASTEIADANGFNAFQIADREEHTNVAEYLEDK